MFLLSWAISIQWEILSLSSVVLAPKNKCWWCRWRNLPRAVLNTIVGRGHLAYPLKSWLGGLWSWVVNRARPKRLKPSRKVRLEVNQSPNNNNKSAACPQVERNVFVRFCLYPAITAGSVQCRGANNLYIAVISKCQWPCACCLELEIGNMPFSPEAYGSDCPAREMAAAVTPRTSLGGSGKLFWFLAFSDVGQAEMRSLCHSILRAYFSVGCLALGKRGHTWLHFCGLWPVSFCPVFHNWSMLNLWPMGTFRYQSGANLSFTHQSSDAADSEVAVAPAAALQAGVCGDLPPRVCFWKLYI